MYAHILLDSPCDAEALYMRGLSRGMQVQPDQIRLDHWLAALEIFLRESRNPVAAKKRILTDANTLMERVGNRLVAEKERRGDRYLPDYIRCLLELAEMACHLLSTYDLKPDPEDKDSKWEYLRFLHNALVACDNILIQKAFLSADQQAQALSCAKTLLVWKEAAANTPQEPSAPKERWWRRRRKKHCGL